MLSFLHDHPFEVEAFFDTSLVLSFAAPTVELKPLVPSCLEIDALDRWGFIAAAMVQTRSLRPKGFPTLLGRDFFLVGYRVFVRYVDKAGRILRGLYILGSATDSCFMEAFGNIFTH